MATSTLKTPQYRDSNISTVKIADSAIIAKKITDSTIIAKKITDSTISARKIADSTISARKITDSTITLKKIADSAITGRKIADDTITGSKLANSITIMSNLTVEKNFRVKGTTTTIDSTTVTYRDPMLLVGDPGSGASAIASEAGFEVERGTGTNAKIYFDEADDTWKVHNGSAVHVLSRASDFVDNEELTATGITFVLSTTPAPATSLKLYYNGQRLFAGGGNDFTLAQSTITFLNDTKIAADVLLADFRL